ncbi:hypothetical protein KP509_1Z061800 [Ceratopteris richardii]|nr:hypothetical protein KP509_1Z061800 [Ceratopteris richardii]
MARSTAYAAALVVLLAFVFVHHHSSDVRVRADTSAEDNGDLLKVVENVGGAVPDALTTDVEVVKRESKSIKSFDNKAEKFAFQAEVSELMDIIINSLYSNKDIFLWELISNASDALDKIHFMALTDKEVLGEGDDTKLEIQIKLDKANKILSIRDRGIGMTKDDLIKNLDYVEVVSKHNDDKQYIGESKADAAFAELVQKYSEFINFSIYVWTSKEVGVEVEADSKDEDEKTASTKDEESDEDAESKSKTKKVKETTWDWQLLSDVKAIWLRSPKEILDEDYANFFHSIANDLTSDKHLSWTHFTAEGDVEFKAILYILPKAPHDLYENYYSNKSFLKLYVRRVFISDEFDDLLPKYLEFLKGIVDSDAQPLNVSREMLRTHNSLKTIKKKLIRKALDIIRCIVDGDPDEADEKEDDNDNEGEDENRSKYTRFWNEFGKSIKLDIIEDVTNINRPAKLQRFHSTKSGDKLASLDQYITHMKPDQKDIYYITGSSKEQLENSPFLEQLEKKGYEVLFFIDPIDEYLMQYLMDYVDKKFQNVSKEGLARGCLQDPWLGFAESATTEADPRF